MRNLIYVSETKGLRNTQFGRGELDVVTYTAPGEGAVVYRVIDIPACGILEVILWKGEDDKIRLRAGEIENYIFFLEGEKVISHQKGPEWAKDLIFCEPFSKEKKIIVEALRKCLLTDSTGKVLGKAFPEKPSE